MKDSSLLVGRVLRSSTSGFTIGTKALADEVPRFGSFVKGSIPNRYTVMGLIYDVAVGDDPFVRQLIAPDVADEIIADHRENRLAIEVSVLVVGYLRDGGIHQYLPPQPPLALDKIETCSSQEVLDFTRDFTYFRTVLNAKDAPADELLAASLRLAADARGTQSRDYLVRAGRELSRLLAFDAVRLEGLLRRIKP